MILKIGLIVLLVVLVLLLSLLLVVLFVPFILRINTDDNTYRLEWKGIVSCWISGPLENIRLNLKAPLYKKSFDPFKQDLMGPKEKKSDLKKKGEKDKQSGKSFISKRQILAMVRSFRVHICNVSIDTGDYVHNALLIPLFQVVNRKGGNFSVSFQGESSLQFYASNSLWRLGRAYIINLSKLKN